MLYVGHSQYGRGVFTSAVIPKGELIETCPTLLVPKLPNRPFTDLECQLRRFAFSWSEDLDAIALGLGSIYNHSNHPNLRVVADKAQGTIKFYANRTIDTAEELLSSYGFDPRFQAFTKDVELKIDSLRRKARDQAIAMERKDALATRARDETSYYEDIFKDRVD